MKGGHKNGDKHAGHAPDIFARKFWISLALTIPVVFDNFGIIDFGNIWYASFVLASLIFFYGGWIFIKGAYFELLARLPGMMTLIGLAITTAYGYSVYAVFAGKETLFWELTTLITVMLLGHWLEMRAVRGAQGALRELSKLLPDTAEVVAGSKGHETRIIPLEELKAGDLVLVRPGGKIPADGEVTDGHSEVNESIMTGESMPVLKKSGSEVVAGAINGDGSLTVKVTKIGEKTFLAGVIRLVQEAQASKSRLQLLSDRAAFYLTLVAITSGLITFFFWLLGEKDTAFAFERLVAVLVIACPHALGLAVPLVASISTTLAARHGFLVKRRLALEVARSINVVVFDKTGTLTKGDYSVQEIFSDGVATDEVLRLAASADSQSEHFVARAIVAKAKEKGVTVSVPKEFARLPGVGVKANIGGAEVIAGGAAVLRQFKSVISAVLESESLKLSQQGKTIIYVVLENKVIGILALADTIREESKSAIAALHNMGVRVVMITGDSEDVARWVANETGIDEYFARVLPGEKSEKIKLLQTRGLKVAMVGDGINDAPALTQADLGIAIGAGTNVAIESAGIILVKDDPRDIVKIIRLSQLTYRKMLQNLFWATFYNLAALPLAAGVLASKGILLQPAASALLMSLSTMVVAFNALLLRKTKLS